MTALERPAALGSDTRPPRRLSWRRSDAGVWANRDFVKLWGGQTTSLFGTQITTLALPVTAIVLFRAGGAQLGLLNAVQYLPVALVTLGAGVIADSRSRRSTLIIANLGSALALAFVPVLSEMGLLRIGALYAIAFVAGSLAALFNVAYIAYVPTIVRRDQLVDANSKLQGAGSVAQMAGQGSAGVLIQLVTAPCAVLFDVGTFVVAALTLMRVRVREPARPVRQSRARDEIREGLRITWGHPNLRILMVQSAFYNALLDIVIVVVPLYALRTLHLSSGLLGLTIASGSAGAAAGAVVAGRVAAKLGSGGAIVVGMSISCFALLLIPLAGGSRVALLIVLAAGYTCYGAGEAIFNVHSVAMRQQIVPDHLLGRVAATYRFVAWASIPAGGLIGGVLAARFGARITLLGTSVVMVLGCIWFAHSGILGLELEALE